MKKQLFLTIILILGISISTSAQFACGWKLATGTKTDKIKDYSLSHLHTKIEFSYENKVYNTQINMVGSYNVYNYLTALMLVNKLGFKYISDKFSDKNLSEDAKIKNGYDILKSKMK